MWFQMGTDELIKKAEINTDYGLTNEDVEARRKKFGYNRLKSAKKKSIFRLLFEQINDLLIYILIGAALISALMGETSDTVIILIVIAINAIVGVIQESKAEKAMEALKKLSTPKAVVKRDGRLQEIPSEEIVPGDLIFIDAGRYIPCDIRLIETANLKIDESALTGESVPSEKDADVVLNEDKTPLGDQLNMAFMSTLATYGRGVGIAVNTGMDTEVGKIAKMLDTESRSLTPLQKRLEELGKKLGIAAIGICGIMFIVAVFQHRNIFEMFLTAISLAVAAIPEGLPAIVTIVLAIGVQRMIKQNAIVRKMPAIETLGAVNVICSDKTGTLTQNKMTVTKFYSDNNLDALDHIDINNPVHKLLLESLILCNDASISSKSKTGDPTEIALLDAGIRFDLHKEELLSSHKRLHEIPFDSDRKLMTTVNEYEDKYYSLTKGAIDNILKYVKFAYINGNIVPITDDIKKGIIKASNSMSRDALRVLGSAFKILDNGNISSENLEKDLIFIGLVGMIDPPREEVKDSIEVCNRSGIKTVMITGDHKNTAYAIANELGIADSEDQAISGIELDSMSDEDLTSMIENLRVFARVSPEHKVKIVKALKAKGNIVAMTGDGVNDAPSLKAADIGVSMGITGTDVAKGASDIILTDDNFSTIVRAVEEGRNIYNNIKKSILFLLSCNIGEIISLFVAILFGWAAPLRPIHILWVNLITDTLPALSLGMDPGDPEIMKERPRKAEESLFADGGGIYIILNGILIGGLTLAAFLLGKSKYPGSLMHAQTMAFVVLSVSQLFHSLNLRNPEKSIFQVGLFTNKYIIWSLLIGIFLQNIVIIIPPLAQAFKVTSLTLEDLFILLLLSITPLIVNEIVKFIIRYKNKAAK